MNKKEILNLYKNKITELDKYNKFYYEKSDPLLSDAKYDDLKVQILNLEKQYSFLKSDLSPSKIVGFKPSKNFQKFSHKIPMLSLSNAFSEKDLENFEKKILNYLNKDEKYNLEYSAEPKIDGISASLIYKDGKFIRGLSRGDGKEGEDITQNLKTISDIPKSISNKDFPKDIDIRGEVYIQTNDFIKIKDKFANPRNAASGSLRQKNPDETKKIPLKFIAYTYGYQNGLSLKNQNEFLKKLFDWGFKINPHNKIISGIKNLIKNYDKIEKIRSEINFDIDGIVYKINDFELQNRLGYVANSPRWAIAHKFSSNKAISQVINIEIQVGRTGALTPVAKIKPVNIGGVMVSNATLHNEDEIIRKDIRVNDVVVIERAGDVIPHILEVKFDKRKKNSKNFVFPDLCPSCGSKTVKEFNITTKKKDAVRRCISEGFDCEKVAIEKLKHFVSKEAFNIDGFGKKIVEKFWNLGLVRFPQDIFSLDYKKIEKLEGWGSISTNNLKFSIDEKKRISLEKFIYALGIRHIGFESAKMISKNLKTVKNFLELKEKSKLYELENLDGIGETQIKSLINFFSNKANYKMILELNDVLKVEKVKEIETSGKLINKTFMLTGKLSDMSRAEAKTLIENNSGSVVSNVSKKLDYLIVGEKPTKKKIDKANELDVKIINQSEWLKLINKTG